jgi:3',5'-cyclic AMP phosphodiesterase CpdA
MRTIAHLSDLHFGTEIPEVVAGLAADVQAQSPSLVVVSGDLTQRARSGQFRAARAFLDRLPQPRLVVPGNHDIPLFDVTRRFLAPLSRYGSIISRDLDPLYQDAELFVSGLNTARSFTWQSGRISTAQLQALRARLPAAGDRLKVVVTHHPFIPPPDDGGIKLVGRAALAIPLLDAYAVDLLLAGHLHRGYAGDIRSHYPAARRSVIVAQAGTAISGRTRSEPNAYNWITLERTRITVTVRAWTGSAFTALRGKTYELTEDGWHLGATR